jgi:hypothetical protein
MVDPRRLEFKMPRPKTVQRLFASHPTPHHPNLRRFSGALCTVGQPSDKAPSGARGHTIIVTREAAIKALPSLLCMGINYGSESGKHQVQHKCGIITEAKVCKNLLWVGGYIYSRDFPDLMKKLAAPDLGMSYESVNCDIQDICAKVWTVVRLIFSGAAVVPVSQAAYKSSSFTLES